MDAEVYSGGELIGEYEYPSINPTAGMFGGYDQFAREAVGMARRSQAEGK